jgi:hypothetical protein
VSGRNVLFDWAGLGRSRQNGSGEGKDNEENAGDDINNGILFGFGRSELSDMDNPGRCWG